jgi:hypothetical protein
VLFNPNRLFRLLRMSLDYGLNKSRAMFYFLQPGKHTPSHSNIVRPSGIERPTFNEGLQTFEPAIMDPVHGL